MSVEKETALLYQGFVAKNEYDPADLLSWFVGHVLAAFGVVTGAKAPDGLRDWLAEQRAEYARIVKRAPFADVIGCVYEQLASRRSRSRLGQYFTPEYVADMMCEMAFGDTIEERDGMDPERLIRLCEPACGSGVLVLRFLRKVFERDGRSGGRRWSITAIDLDPLCAQISAAQVLANVCTGEHALGELVVYAGNALGPSEELKVVVHATARDMRPDLVLPATHPSRLAALREAVAVRAVEDGAAASRVRTDAGPTPARQRKTAVKSSEQWPGQIDLFSD